MTPRVPAGTAANDNGTRTKSGRASKPCPVCSKPSVPEHRPFCSARCKDVDLHRWLGGTYSIPAEAKPMDGAENDD